MSSHHHHHHHHPQHLSCGTTFLLLLTAIISILTSSIAAEPEPPTPKLNSEPVKPHTPKLKYSEPEPPSVKLNSEPVKPLIPKVNSEQEPPVAMLDFDGGDDGQTGTRWAVLVSGSNSYDNYRHQADVCHAYQVLRRGGLKEENIIVFMYDDIAFNPLNPRPGVIINKPNGPDVYEGVPKDYTGKEVTTANFYAVLLGDRTGLTGGSGKVVDSGPNDHIFIYYADHGGTGVLGMPEGSFVYAKDLVEVLKTKHAANAYKSMVVYIEACESGSIFDHLLPKDLNIYATTAANSHESSFAAYCPGDNPGPSDDFNTCLGDLYSISWLEDCDKHDLSKETLGQQYEVVRRKTANSDLDASSHVMQFGNMNQRNDILFSYVGTNPENANYTSTDINAESSPPTFSKLVDQRDADLLHLRHKFHKAPFGSEEKREAQKQLLKRLSHRKHIDFTINKIAELLFGYWNSKNLLNTVRGPGQPTIEDWDCFKMIVKTYEEWCGPLSYYGMKYARGFANICNSGISVGKIVEATKKTCSKEILV
ncbi:vacuolar-processing enzyme-like [Ziziphus jujuba]|uniref:Vacuolar-processing enzyme-like n=1 Tax=Ziziphus jujuba TaxID=326968 RepID=A0A6P3Z7X7_ZIZJJ|nr:vacuolar-processing enzyme-like [Ziziphus jujuba]